MKKLILSLLLVSTPVLAEDNIVSLVFGDGPSNVTASGSPSQTTTTTTTKTQTKQGNGNGAGNGNHTTTTTATTTQGQTYNSGLDRGGVAGIQYLRRVQSSNLWMGLLIQSNKTYSLSIGVGF